MELIENMAANDHAILRDQAYTPTTKSLLELTSQDTLLAWHKLLAKQLETLTEMLSKLPQQLQAVQPAHSSVMHIGGCNICGRAHELGMCMVQDDVSKEVNYMTNPHHQGGPPRYNQGGYFSQGQGWRSHPGNNFNRNQGVSSNRPPN